MSGVEVNTQKPVEHYYDTHTLYIDCGVATEIQIAESLKSAIFEAQKYLAGQNKTDVINKLTDRVKKLKKDRKIKDLKKAEQTLKLTRNKSISNFNTEKCMYKINLLVTKEGAYHGYGYMRISSSKIYWMLLGRNPDGSERFEEIPDPNWSPPEKEENNLSFEQIMKNNENKTWADKVEEEEKHIQPMLRTALPPLITMPGFKYDEDQYLHLKDIAETNGEDPDTVPDTGYFEISRGFAKEAQSGMIKHRICARNVPDWLPLEAFAITFKPYITTSNKYPKVNFIQTKKGKIVFINFDPSTTDALFALLMTRKTRFTHPDDDSLKCELVFMHAFDNKKKR